MSTKEDPLFAEIPDPYDTRVPPSLTAQVAAPEHAGPDRASVQRRRGAAVVAALAVTAAWVAFEGTRRFDSPLFVAWAVGLPALAASIAGVAMMKEGRLGLGLDATSMRIALGIAGVAFAASAFYAPEGADRVFTMRSTMGCGALGLIMALVPFALAFGAYRDALRTGAVTRLAACGFATGALGAVVLRLHCPHDDALHVLLGHGAPPVILAALALGMRRAR